jgi:hypothetical protein
VGTLVRPFGQQFRALPKGNFFCVNLDVKVWRSAWEDLMAVRERFVIEPMLSELHDSTKAN